MNKAKIIEALTALRAQLERQDAIFEQGIDTYPLTSDVRALLTQAIAANLCGVWLDFKDDTHSRFGLFRNVLLYVATWVDDPTGEAIGDNGADVSTPGKFVNWICETYELKAE